MKKIIALSAIACAALVGCATNGPEALDTTETAEGFREGKFGKPFVVRPAMGNDKARVIVNKVYTSDRCPGGLLGWAEEGAYSPKTDEHSYLTIEAEALAEEGGGNNSVMLDDIWVLMESGFVDVGYSAVECATLDGTSDLLDPISEGEAHKKSRTYLVRNEAEKIAIGNYEFDIDKGN